MTVLLIIALGISFAIVVCVYAIEFADRNRP